MHGENSQPMTIAEIIEAIATPPLPVYITAYDGSATGPADAPFHFHVASKSGLAYTATAPGDLGLCRAYLTGGLQVEGEHLAHPYKIFDALQDMYHRIHKPSPADSVRIVKSLRALDAFHVQPMPANEQTSRFHKTVVEHMARHSEERDKQSISAHYDLSNDFYRLFLGPSMTYTCAYYPEPTSSLEDAQQNKYRLVFDKLHLKPGDRLLDIGCGWGGMVIYAAKHGVKTLGVTLSEEQYKWGAQAIKDAGLEDMAEVRCMDYRDVPEGDFDAISAIGILEHIGYANYRSYFELLYSKLVPGGRMLNHCITYPDNHRRKAGKFIDRYIFPDGELSGSGTIIMRMQDAGFEVLHEENLRFDYQRTLNAWCENLKANWDEARDIVGDETARLWGLYMAGCEWGFEHNVVQLHQVLGVKLLEDGSRGDLPERMWWQV